MTTPCELVIVDSIGRLVHHPAFTSWLASGRAQPGDVILVNNSFVFRDVKTTKADAFLSLTVRDPPGEPEIGVASGISFNTDFKRLAGTSTNLPASLPLSEAIEPELLQLGHLVFLLIGAVEDTEIITSKLNHEAFQRIVWDPTMPETARVEPDQIVVNRTDDEELVWQSVADHYIITGDTEPEGLREALGVALDHLQDGAIARVRIPTPGESSAAGITDDVVTVLREQRDEYALAVAALGNSDPTAASALNDVLRIAYNFASDATGFLRLIVSICDLKPIVLWGTIAEHYALSEAFRSLPWLRSHKKASLKNYQQAIADARNSAFHNLFPFRKSLRIQLPETALGTPELQIFSEHTKKGENQLTYRDKELVDVLVEFTRARDRRLALSFWQRNLDLMDATIHLFERTNDFLKVLAEMREP
jgi:hypothetical protein